MRLYKSQTIHIHDHTHLPQAFIRQNIRDAVLDEGFDGFGRSSRSAESNPSVVNAQSVGAGVVILSNGLSSKKKLVNTEAESGLSCTAWYWCTSYGCEFVGITCNLDEGVPPGDGGGSGSGGDPKIARQGCAQCMSLAQRAKDTRMSQAKYELATNLAFGCPAGAVSAGFTAAELFAWINAIPEAGQVIDLVIGLIGAALEYSDCVTRHILSYRTTEADANNNYYKDARDCREKYDDCK